MALPGFRDFYPDECAARNAIFSTWREVARRYGFVEYDGPPLEPLDLFTKKSGQEIVGQLYNFTDKGDRAVALRPEMTPTLARMVTARHKDFKKPLKWFALPQVFRYERQQRGRLREHYQFNCDIIGEAGLEADVELIALLIDTLRAFRLTDRDFVVRLSDRQFWTDFMDARQIPEEERYAFIHAIDKSEREGFEQTSKKLLAIEKAAEEKARSEGQLAVLEKILGAPALNEEVHGILNDPSTFPSKRLDTIETGLRQRGLGDYVKRDFTVVRGLAYYTGVVFEAFDRSGEFRAIAGGGRYDNLLKNLGGVDLPALGFGMGDVVLGELLKSKPQPPGHPASKGWSFFVAVADETFRPQAMKLLADVRRHSGRHPVHYAFQPGRLGKQLQQAEELGCEFAFIVDQTIQEGQVGLKDLVTREQIQIPVGDTPYGLLKRCQDIWVARVSQKVEEMKAEGGPTASA